MRERVGGQMAVALPEQDPGEAKPLPRRAQAEAFERGRALKPGDPAIRTGTFSLTPYMTRCASLLR